MRQNLELLEEAERFTAGRPGVAVKACTDRGDCWVYADGGQKYEPGGTAPFPVKKPGEPIEFMSLTLTRFWLGTWNEALQRFVPQGSSLSEEEFCQRLRGASSS